MTINRRQLLGAGMGFRTIDPVRDIQRAADEDHGLLMPSAIERRRADQEKFTAELDRTQRIIVFETIEYVLYDVPANSDNSMYHLFAASASAISLNNMAIDIGCQCRICALRIMSNAAVTAGTCTPFVRVTEDGVDTDYVFDECQLSTTETRKKGIVFDWPTSIQISKGANYLIALRTSAAFAPTTLDMKAHVTFGYDQGAYN